MLFSWRKIRSMQECDWLRLPRSERPGDKRQTGGCRVSYFLDSLLRLPVETSRYLKPGVVEEERRERRSRLKTHRIQITGASYNL